MIGLIPLQPQPQAWLWRSDLSRFAERYCEYLVESGYAARTINIYVRCVAHFAHWLTTQRIAVTRVDDRLARSFINGHLPRCTCPDPIPRGQTDISAALQHLLIVLGACSAPRFLLAEPESVQLEVFRFTEYLKEVCGLAECTRYQRGRIIRLLASVLWSQTHRHEAANDSGCPSIRDTLPRRMQSWNSSRSRRNVAQLSAIQEFAI